MGKGNFSDNAVFSGKNSIREAAISTSSSYWEITPNSI